MLEEIGHVLPKSFSSRLRRRRSHKQVHPTDSQLTGQAVVQQSSLQWAAALT